MYQLARPLLFSMDAERAHHLTLAGLSCAAPLATQLYARSVPAAPRRVMGLEFANPVGLAAGLDKDGACIDGLAALGFGFLEVGTVTPRAQPGNPQPRLFRLPDDRALINRMGFNNRGVAHLVQRIRASRHTGVLGVNIGKNFDTPNARAIEDYAHCLQAVYPVADYVTVNISSPNTKNLRDLQTEKSVNALLAALSTQRQQLAGQQGRRVPLALKIAPDLDVDALKIIADAACKHDMDALIATNTTIARPGLRNQRLAKEQGGLSGQPVRDMATAAIATLSEHLQGQLPIIGVGGIMNGADAREKLAAGASLVQIYSGLIYRGPSLVRDCVEATLSSNSPNK